MLEPFDAAKWTANIVAHFEDLTKAHEAVQRARAQLTVLGPLLAECDAHDKAVADIAALTAQRNASKYYFADLKAGLVDRLLADLSAERASLQLRLADLAARLKDLRSRERSLDIELAGHGGNRLAEIDRLLKEGEAACRARMDRAEEFGKLLAQAGLDPVETAAHFTARRGEIASAREAAKQDLADAQNRLTDAGYAAKGLEDKAAGVNAELVSLREHPNNIPKRQLDLRAWMCRVLRLEAHALPFAGELIAVRPAETDWEGAAERLLRGFALSVLVPEQHYAAVSDWIDGHHLKARVVYYRVPDPAREGRTPPPNWSPRALAAKLDIKDHPFALWLERELARRADFECVETMAEFRRAAKAITKAGQFKGDRGRHEKDDRNRIDDRSQYVLGWSNERKLEALIWQATSLADQLSAVSEEQTAYQKVRDAAIECGQVLARLEGTREFADIDWHSVVNRTEELRAEKRELEAASAELARLNRDLETVREQIGVTDATHGEVQQRLGSVDNEIARAGRSRDEASVTLAEPGCEPARARFTAIADLVMKILPAPPSTAEACDKAEHAASDQIGALIERRNTRKASLGNKIVSLMGEFRAQYPVETEELDAAVEAADGYRELHQRLTDDDLPRFQQQFKTYLNQNTIRDIAGFQSQLNKQADSRTFRFAVIDEAFGRGSDESTRFALELFARLGLQLLIVTPLQKIHVIEPYVSAVGFVDNPTSSYSRLQTLTIEEYHARRLAHVIGQQTTASGAQVIPMPAAAGRYRFRRKPGYVRFRSKGGPGGWVPRGEAAVGSGGRPPVASTVRLQRAFRARGRVRRAAVPRQPGVRGRERDHLPGLPAAR